MVPLAVDPQALFAAGSAVVAAGDGVAANLTVSTAGFAAHTGLDAAGTVFGLQYQSAAESLLKAAAATINACRSSGAKIQLGASNYSRAEAASTLGGGGEVLPPTAEPVKVTAPGPPGTLGPGQPPPPLWALIQSFVDDVWPDGDAAGMHAAAGRWRSFGAALTGIQGALNASKSLIGAQQMPEGDKVTQVLSQIGDSANNVGAQCGRLAATLDNFANEVSQAQNSIRDLLHRLGSLADLGHDVMLIFEGDALEELEKIANDIKGVLHNLGREARAFEQAMNMGVQVMDGLVVDMEKHMRGEFKRFLGDDIGNKVATVFDTWVNTQEGFVKGAIGMVQGLEQLDPRWFLLDPKGAAATWTGMMKTGLLYHFINPQGAWDADKQMFRSVLHLDDWRADRPGLGAGENIFDVATFFLPGVGEAGAGAKGAAAGARAAEEGGEAADAAGAAGRAGEGAGEAGELAAARGELGDIGATGTSLTKDLEGVAGDMPEAGPPISGQPVALPPEAPVEHAPSPVESMPPSSHEAAAPPADVAHAPVAPTADPPTGVGEPAPAPAGGVGEPAHAPTGGVGEPAPAPVGGGPHEPGGVPPPGPHEPLPPAADGPHEPPAAQAPHEPVPPNDGPRDPVPSVAEDPHGPVPSAADAPRDPVPVPAGAHEPALAPAAAPHVPTSAGVPGERLPSISPQTGEPVPARTPVSSSGTPVEPTPAAIGTPQRAPAVASAAPGASTPHFTSPSARPAEGPPPGGDIGPRGPGHGGRHGDPHGRPHHGGSRHGHGDGNADAHSPSDGSPGDHEKSSDGDSTTGETLHGSDAGPPPPVKVPGVDYSLPAADALRILEHPGAEVQRLAEGGVPAEILDGYEPLAGRTVEQFKQEFTIHGPNGETWWDWDNQAPRNGFAGEPAESSCIPKDFRLDRLGSNGGGFLSPEGTPLAERATPPGLATQYHIFEGTGNEIPIGKDWVVQHGPTKQAFGQPGGGDQWIVLDKNTNRPVPVDELIVERLLRDLTPPE